MRARLPSGAAAGCLVFFGLFCLGLIEATSLSYMGETDDRWVSIVLGRYAGEVAFAQGLLLLTYLACGGVLGAVAALARAGVRPVPLRRMHAVLLDAAIVLLLHGAVLGWGIAHRPTAYAEWLYERGGLRASLHVLAADHLPPWLYLAVPALVGVFALRGLWVSLASPRRRLTVFGGLACLAGAACLAAIVHSPPRLPPPPEDRPHLVILAIDSLRDDRLAPGGPAARLAEVAARGARFERVLVPLARTFPSWVSLLTAQLPVRHGVRHMFPAPGALQAVPEALPAHLGRSGWRSAVVGDYAADVFSRWGAGFDEVRVPGFDLGTITRMRGLAAHHHLFPYLDQGLGRRAFPDLKAHADLTDPDAVAREALDVFDELAAGGDPVLLTVFFSGAHFPYAAARPFRGSRTDPAYRGPYRYRYSPNLRDDAPLADEDVVHVRGLYDEAVAAADAAAGRLLDGLSARGVLERTVVVITADHGEELHEVSGGFEHGAHLRGDAFLQVPLVLAGPGVPEGRTVRGLARSIDLSPTLLDLIGQPALPGERDGVSLAPALRDATLPPLVAHAETGAWLRASGKRFYQQDRLPYPGIAQLLAPLPDGGVQVRPELEDRVVAAKHRMAEDARGRLIVVPTPAGPREEWTPAPGGPPAPPPELRHALARIDRLDGERRAYRGPARLPPPPGEPKVVVRERLLDRLADAELEVPALAEALRRLRGYRRWIFDPWTGRRPRHRLGLIFGHKPDPGLDWHQNRRALYLPPPGRAAWRLTLPEGAALSFGMLSPRDILPGPPVRFVVRVRPAGEPGPGRTVFDAVVDRRSSPGRGDWADRTVSLGDLARRSVDLELETSLAGGRPGDVAHAFFSAPVVLGDSRQPRPAWNLLFVQVDALRRTDVAALGGPAAYSGVPGLTPALDSLVHGGTAFEHAVVNHTWTRPSTLALMTGMTSDELGVNRHTIRLPVAHRRSYYRARPPLLPRELRERGWRADASVNNLFMLPSHSLGLDFGFQRMGDFRHLVQDTPQVAASAQRFLRDNAGARWFLFFNLNALHMPYTAPRRYWRRVEELAPDAGDWPRQRRGYLAELAYTDEHLGHVLATLEETGQRERTLIVLSADHGEIMDSAHDRLSAIRDKRSLWHHGITPFDEELLVPLVFVAPGVLPAGRRIAEQAQCLDLAPTLHELLGLPREPLHRGASLAGALLRGEPLADRPLRTVGRFYRSVRTRELKYVRHEVRRGGAWRPEGREELYDLASDPLEHHDLAAGGDPRLARARILLEGLEEDFARPRPMAAAAEQEELPVEDLHLDDGIDPEIEKLLGEWGYL